MQVAHNDNLSFGNTTTDIPFSFTTWLYVENTGSAKYITARAVNINAVEYYVATETDNDIIFACLDNDLTEYISIKTASPSIDTLQWLHLAVTYDGSGIPSGQKMYINGIEQAVVKDSVNYTAMHDHATSINSVGSFGGVSHMEGNMDQVCYWRNVELTQQEIKELMTIRDVTEHSQAANLVLYHEYDSPDSTQANGITDLSSGGNPGTMQNGTYSDLVSYAIPWPYPYQLDTLNYTPMQSAASTSFGGFTYELDGSTEYLSVGDNNVLSRGNGTTDQPFSGSAWIYSDLDQNEPIISKADEYQLQINSAKNLSITLTDASTGGTISKERSTTWNIGDDGYRWNHVAFSYGGCGDTSCLNLYLNGVDVGDQNAVTGSYTAMENTANDLYLGRAATQYLSGGIGDIFLSDEEITDWSAIYNNHAPGSEATDNKIVYYRGYNSTISTATDLSANSLNASLVNSPAVVYEYPRRIWNDSTGSFDIDGVNEWGQASDADIFSYTDGAGTDLPFTWSVRTNADIAGLQYYFYKWSVGGNREYYCFYDNTPRGEVIVLLGEASGSDYLAVNTTTNLVGIGGYYSLTVTYDGSETAAGIKVYFNGIRQPLNDLSSGVYTGMSNGTSPLDLYGRATDRFLIGATGYTIMMKGLELTGDQVLEMHNDGSPEEPVNWSFYGDWTDAALWYLNKKDNITTVFDRINSNNITMQNLDADDIIDASPTN